jgi:hypothetical protein
MVVRYGVCLDLDIFVCSHDASLSHLENWNGAHRRKRIQLHLCIRDTKIISSPALAYTTLPASRHSISSDAGGDSSSLSFTLHSPLPALCSASLYNHASGPLDSRAKKVFLLDPPFRTRPVVTGPSYATHHPRLPSQLAS